MSIRKVDGPAKKNIEKAIKDLDKKEVAKSGWVRGSHYLNGTPVAKVAYWQEFGTPNARFPIPPRPFFRPAVAQLKNEWSTTSKIISKKIATGKLTVHGALETLGLRGQGVLRKKIVEVNAPPLSPVTIVLRRWKKKGKKINFTTVLQAISYIEREGKPPGAGSVKPLNDTGYMLATVTSTVGKE